MRPVVYVESEGLGPIYSPYGKTYTHRAVMAFHVFGLLKLSKDILSQHFPELDTHLIYERGLSALQTVRQISALPKELMPQTTPCTKILCSYSAMSAPYTEQVSTGSHKT